MRITCNLPNASEKINGVAFKKRGDVMVSEDIDQDVADGFLSIPGYAALSDQKEPEKAADKAPAKTPGK